MMIPVIFFASDIVYHARNDKYCCATRRMTSSKSGYVIDIDQLAIQGDIVGDM